MKKCNLKKYITGGNNLDILPHSQDFYLKLGFIYFIYLNCV